MNRQNIMPHKDHISQKNEYKNISTVNSCYFVKFST